MKKLYAVEGDKVVPTDPMDILSNEYRYSVRPVYVVVREHINNSFKWADTSEAFRSKQEAIRDMQNWILKDVEDRTSFPVFDRAYDARRFIRANKLK